MEGNSSGDVDLNAKIDNLRVRMQQSSLPNVNKYVGTQHTRPINGLQNPNSGLDRSRIVMDALHTDGDQIRVLIMAGHTSKGARDTTTSYSELPTRVTMNPSSSLGDANVGAVGGSKNPNTIYGYPKPFSVELSVSGFDKVSGVEGESFGVHVTNAQTKTIDPSHESPIVQSVNINSNPTTYCGAVGSGDKDQSNEDGINLIATYLGKPIMLDSYTSSMCKDSWGRSSFARCLIEINLEAEFKESITIGKPDLDGPGHTKETIRVIRMEAA
ncbi:hypothetical protein Tco_1146043 [Tanacetum coccineum]